ncbi:MAG TPA: glycosyl hydrolase 108 family protein [Dissulfurispiraceae bacterium]|nr:glycosyl hydrolase 108 family protein [Dissulfurispiraceae bacterium]
MKDLSLNPQQQILLISELLSKGTPAAGSNSFEALLEASLGQVEKQAAPLDKGPAVQCLPPLPVSGPALMKEGGRSRFKEILATVLKHEGSAYVQKDGGTEASKFGILQSTAGAYGYKGNIRNITRAEAEAIYKQIWDKSGAESLPYPLSLVHFDTYVNSPAAAVKLLKKCAGSTDSYLALRAYRYTRLAELRPARYGKYLKGWIDRIADLRNITAGHSVHGNFPPDVISSAGTTDNKTIIV